MGGERFMLEPVEIRGDIKDFRSKDGSVFEFKIETELSDEELIAMRRLHRGGKAVFTIEPAVQQPSLPAMDRPAERTEDVPGQAKLFGTDGKPRIRVRCRVCNTETTQREFSSSEKATSYLCDVCGELNVFETLRPDDDHTEGEGEPVASAKPVTCPECGLEMRFNAEDKTMNCVDPECGYSMDAGNFEVATEADAEPKSCPRCGAPMDWSEGLDGWVCSGEECEQVVARTKPGDGCDNCAHRGDCEAFEEGASPCDDEYKREVPEEELGDDKGDEDVPSDEPAVQEAGQEPVPFRPAAGE
jgi:hypothetical protein